MILLRLIIAVVLGWVVWREPSLLWQLVPVALFGPIASNRFYWLISGLGGTIGRNVVPNPNDWTTGGHSGSYGLASNCYCYDRKTDVLFAAIAGIIGSLPTSRAAGSIVASGLPGASGIDCDPTGSRLFYISFNVGSAAADLRKINYDGTGDTSLITWTASNDTGEIHYDHGTDRIYYVKGCFTGGRALQLRYIKPDGSGDSLVYDIGGVGNINFYIPSFTIDIAGGYLFWVESYPVVGGNLYRSDLSGGGVTSLVSAVSFTGFADGYVTFSQLLNKVFLWKYDSHVHRLNPDGSGDTDLGIPTGAQRGKLALGIGFETIGHSAIL